MPIKDLQRRFMELGRLRMGDKGPKGEPKKLTEWRLTSASRELLEAAADIYGGTVLDWEDAPDDGYFELYTTTSVLDVWLPPVYAASDGSPTYSWSQWFELWSGGGCKRRCDGVTEMLSGKPCVCRAEDPLAEPSCKMTTRVNVILWRLPGVGVWRLESHGYNAATLLPGTLELLQRNASMGEMVDAKLRIEQRTSKQDGQTRKFIVPVLDVPGLSLGEIMGGAQTALNPPAAGGPKPALNAGTPEPNGDRFENDTTPGFGESVPVVSEEDEDMRVGLSHELMHLAEKLGVEDATFEAINRNREKHVNEPEKHLTYLNTQITRARNSLDAKKQT